MKGHAGSHELFPPFDTVDSRETVSGMGRCSGCGAHVWASEESYGHILGCGSDNGGASSAWRPNSPWLKDVQHRILEEAIQGAKVNTSAPNEADALAKALKDRLTYYNSLPPEEKVAYAAGEGSEPVDDVDQLAQELAQLRRRLSQLEGILES